MKETGTVLLGGHSIVDSQLKFGLSVTGIINPGEILDNAHAKPGDLLILTKPLGTGITIMAIKANMADKHLEKKANRSMSMLNHKASLIARKYGASSCTDITGFGFLGHAYQMAKASGVSLEIHTNSIPCLDQVLNFASMGLLAGATYSNRKYLGNNVRFDKSIDLSMQDLLFDPQTSGGLMISCPQDKLTEMLNDAENNLPDTFKVVGRVLEKSNNPLIIVKKK